MQNGEPNVYAALATLRNGYVQGQWSRLQLFLAFNAIAGPVVLATTSLPGVKLLLSFMAVLVHYAVLLGAIRANDWVDYFDGKLNELERLDAESEASACRVQIFSDPDFRDRRQSKTATRFSFITLAIIAIGAWVVALCYNFYLFIIS